MVIVHFVYPDLQWERAESGAGRFKIVLAREGVWIWLQCAQKCAAWWGEELEPGSGGDSYCRMAVVLKEINVMKEKPWTLKNGKKGALGARPHPLQIHLRGQGLEHPTGKWSHGSAFLGSVARYSKVWPKYLIYNCDPRDSSYTWAVSGLGIVHMVIVLQTCKMQGGGTAKWRFAPIFDKAILFPVWTPKCAISEAVKLWNLSCSGHSRILEMPTNCRQVVELIQGRGHKC